MDFWNWVLFLVASYLAVRSLVTLMAGYRRKYAREFLAQELIRRQQREQAGADEREGAASQEASANERSNGSQETERTQQQQQPSRSAPEPTAAQRAA